jgi:predicted HD phosphohydrolase
MHDKFRKKHRVPVATDRLRRQIALEAARRLLDAAGVEDPSAPLDWLDRTGENDFYVAKRKAAAVLGHRVRPGDLPSDTEVREQIVSLWRSRSDLPEVDRPPMLEPEVDEPVTALAEHLDRFALYRMRLEPLESIKQNAKYHPEGDALYHSIQVFQLAREVRPYDEEFLLAALLHDVGKAFDLQDHSRAGVHALRGAVTARTLWLIEHHMDLLPSRERLLTARQRRELESSEFFEDLRLLRELDDAGRVAGVAVETLDQVLAYLRGLENEAYLDE